MEKSGNGSLKANLVKPLSRVWLRYYDYDNALKIILSKIKLECFLMVYPFGDVEMVFDDGLSLRNLYSGNF